MTKAEKGLCSVMGCHTKAVMRLEMLGTDFVKLFCHIHWLEYIAYTTALFAKDLTYKETIISGFKLHNKHSFYE